MLKEKYLQMKDTDDEFEVIHVVERSDSVYLAEYIRCEPDLYATVKTESLAISLIGDLPWLVSLETKVLPADLALIFVLKVRIWIILCYLRLIQTEN